MKRVGVTGAAGFVGSNLCKRLLDDERRFIDLANSPLWLAEENEVL